MVMTIAEPLIDHFARYYTNRYRDVLGIDVFYEKNVFDVGCVLEIKNVDLYKFSFDQMLV